MSSERARTFRIAVRRFDAFERHIAVAWRKFDSNLILEAVPFDFHPLHDTLFRDGGLADGSWDVALIGTDWIAEAPVTGCLADLTPYLALSPPEGWPHAWSDSLLRFQRINGRILGLPFHDGPECLVYRRDLFAAAGLEPPTTWTAFHHAARQLSDPHHSRWGTAFAAYPDGHNTVYDCCLQYWTRGLEPFTADGRLQLNQPGAAQALEWYRTMLRDAHASHPRCRELDSVGLGLAFARGELAMMVNWFGFAALAETGADSQVRGLVDIAPLPADPCPASLNSYWLLGIGAGSPHRDTAWRFLRFCASAEQDRALTHAGAIGCRRSTWLDPEVNRQIPFYSRLEEFHAVARELPRLPDFARQSAIIDRLMTAVISEDTSVSDLLARAQAEAGV